MPDTQCKHYQAAVALTARVGIGKSVSQEMLQRLIDEIIADRKKLVSDCADKVGEMLQELGVAAKEPGP